MVALVSTTVSRVQRVSCRIPATSTGATRSTGRSAGPSTHATDVAGTERAAARSTCSAVGELQGPCLAGAQVADVLVGHRSKGVHDAVEPVAGKGEGRRDVGVERSPQATADVVGRARRR